MAVLEAVVRDRAYARADEPANADVVYPRTHLHAAVVRTARHSVPSSAANETKQGEEHVSDFGRVVGRRILDDGDEACAP